MRKYLIIVPEGTAPAGLVGEAILEAGVSYDTLLPTERYASFAPFDYPGIPKQPDDYAGLIILGGAMSANDIGEFPFLTDTMDLIRRFAAENRPVLGICLGAQVIARAFGGDVYRMEKLESCFQDMRLTEEGKRDPIFSAYAEGITSFHNHFEAVRNIPGAVPLATGGACPIQAFRIGRATYATQYHPEVTLDIVREWIRKFGKAFTDHEPKLVTELDLQFHRSFAKHRDQCRTLVRGWIALSHA